MNADHGPDCAAPPATHVIARTDDMVFRCNNHIMTSVNAGYGAVYLTPNALLDFSEGEAVLRWDMSTLRTSSRDWVDIVLMPWEQNLQVNYIDVHMPQEAVHLLLGGSQVFIPSVVRNYEETRLSADTYHNWDMVLADHGLTASATRRDTFELRLSRTHMKLSFPAYDFTWIDTDINPPLTWDQAVVQLNHRSYNPEKSCNFDGTCRPNTWHWDNINLSPAEPFTILRGDRRYVDSTTTGVVNFGAPSPENARLRFAGVGQPITYSIDGGVTWLSPTVQARDPGKPEVANAYWTPIPAGVTSIQFRGTPNGGRDWGVQDIAIWAPGPQPDQSVAPAPSPRGEPPEWPVTVDFAEANRSGNLEGEYPAGVIDWGGDSWAMSDGAVHFNTPERPSQTFAFVSPARLVRLEVTNAGASVEELKLSCYGQPDVQATLPPGLPTTVETNWTGTCTGVTVTGSVDTLFDNLVVDGGDGAPPAAPTPTPTPTPAATVTTTATTIPTSTPTPGAPSSPTARSTPTPPATATPTPTPIGGIVPLPPLP